MKKCCELSCLARRRWKKITRIMKLTITLLLFAILTATAGSTYSQSARINLKMKDASLVDVFREIERTSEFGFFFKSEELDLNKHVSIDLKNATIDEILEKILIDSYTYHILDKNIIITRSNGNTNTSIQQQKSISGKVTDSTGGPLPGVSVVVKGTTAGTITDGNGLYSLSNVAPNTTLLFSFVGMKSQEVLVSGKTSINVIMTEETVGIEEVVAIGYGTMKKSDLTGSIASVKSENITDLPSNNITQALQGRVAGVQIQQNSGAPGANMQVRIRGTNSIQGSNEPLWIIDGFPGNQNMLNPSDIESLEVLKDASSTAIYGSRGANGVVIITTKRGKAGTTRVDYEGSYSIQTVRKKLDMMNANEYAQLYNIYWKNIKGTEYFTKDQINSFGEGTDWQDLIFRAAPVYDHALSVSGGNEHTQFSVGTSYFDQSGIIKNNDFRRIVLRANVNHDISKKFSISYNAILGRTNNNPTSESDVSRSALTATPTVGPYDDNGKYRFLNNVYPFSPDNLINPIAYFNEVSNNQVTNEIMANLAFTYKPIDGLSIKISGNISNTDSRADSYTGVKYPNSSGSASVNTGNMLHLNSDNIITYNKTINKNHNIFITGALTYEDYIAKTLGASGSGFLSDATQTYNIGSASIIGTPYTAYTDWKLLSYLGRFNYSYKNKYLATLSFRADGSSRYSKGNKWGYFPSGALAWRISEEEFMTNISFISDAKIRLGYGETGSTAIDPYYTLDMLSSGKAIFENALYTYFAPGTRLPGSLKWETTAQTDIGVDIGLLDNRFRLTADYYIKNTRDLLNPVQLPQSMGYTNTVKNIGEIQNKGLDLQFDARVLNGIFKWDVSANISFNKNKVAKLYGGQDIQGTIYSVTIAMDYLNLLREGKPISAFYAYQFNGFDDKGHLTYKDNNNDGVLSEKDKAWIGDPNPDFIYGLNSNMSWKNFDLNIFIQGSQGNDIFSLSMIEQNYKYYLGYNTLKEVLYNHWSPENPDAKYPAIDNTTSTKMSDRFIYDGSYLRLKNIQLAYNIPMNKLGVNLFRKGQIYISGQNLLTITRYPWWDPDVNSKGGSNSVNQGIDYYSYPTAKGFSVGVKLSF